ncbi:hypothetical protein HJC23_011897 [Cyclotella cryptica]|uniref:Peptidase M12B domain-containing protein n=1 Tax=Cyclotella cryptica TaxID=29204 RepID=A0ABD3PPQ4_9STRA
MLLFWPKISALCLFAGLSLFTSAHSEHRRRRLTPNTSIISALKEQIASGIENPHFTLAANLNDGGGLFASNQQVEIDVVLTEPSVTQLTSYSIDGGASTPVQTTTKYFVADQSANETFSNFFSILSIDEDKGVVSGLVQKDGKLFNLEQRPGKPTVVTEVNYDPPKDWKCGVLDPSVDTTAVDPTGSDGKGLTQENLGQEHHRHLDDNHVHDDQHHTLNLRGMHQHDVFAEVRNIDPNILRNRRRASTNGNIWSYQVDLYIEVDEALVNNHDPNDAVNMPNTIAYVSALITAASSIYEREVDTHLNVLHIAKTTLYDSQTLAADALDVMHNHYSSQSWHYVDPNTGESPDLHHAILYRGLNGGIAFLGTICSSRWGYGVSSGIQGSLSQLGGEMFWDIMVVMHEIGHNFGAGHTHEGFSPKVDACGNNQCRSLVNGQFVSAGDATIMSYCDTHCPGGDSNVAFTFGGYSNGGDRSDINNWIDNEGVVPFSYEPRRVPKVMYEHVSTRGTCVDPHNVPPVEGFTKFGQGFCLDASNKWYSGFASDDLPLSTTDTYCLEWCSQNLHNDLVAVEINHDNQAASTVCYCSFSGGTVPNNINLSDYTPAAKGYVTYPGVGPITSTDSTTTAVCYQNINYNNTPKPTSFPTEKPTPKPTSKVRETKS